MRFQGTYSVPQYLPIGTSGWYDLEVAHKDTRGKSWSKAVEAGPLQVPSYIGSRGWRQEAPQEGGAPPLRQPKYLNKFLLFPFTFSSTLTLHKYYILPYSKLISSPTKYSGLPLVNLDYCLTTTYTTTTTYTQKSSLSNSQPPK